jgi:hypothetical protein
MWLYSRLPFCIVTRYPPEFCALFIWRGLDPLIDSSGSFSNAEKNNNFCRNTSGVMCVSKILQFFIKGYL